MTRLPTESQDVVGLDGPEYKLNVRCPIPGCVEMGVEGHHIWRRSFLIGPYLWVRTPDSTVIGNVVRLCPYHHKLITENEASITYVDGLYLYGGEELRWQPPFYSSLYAFQAEALNQEPDSEPPGKENGEHRHESPGVCPTCGHVTKPKIESDPEVKKPRKSWSCAVPVTEQEMGAEVLDELIEASRHEFAAAGLPYGESETVKYYILATALALFVTNAKEILA